MQAAIAIARPRVLQLRQAGPLLVPAVAIALVCGLGYLSARMFSAETGTSEGSPVLVTALPSSCAMLPNAAVAKAFGAAVAYKAPESGFNGCTWAGLPFTRQYGHQVVSIDLASVSEVEFEKAYSTWIVPGATPDTRRLARTTTVRGVGEAAFTQNNDSELEVWDHGVVIEVATNFVSSPLATEKRLAEAVIASLRGPSKT